MEGVKPISISSFGLKIIACATMLIDHIGIVFFPNMIILRIIGRLSFPIFAFLISEGYAHTKSVEKYLARLFVFFVISGPIFQNVIKNYTTLNIFFSLFLGLIAIHIYNKIQNKNFAFLIVILISIFAQMIKTEYGFYGILLIFTFYLFNIENDFKKLLFSQLFLIFPFLYFNLNIFSNGIINWTLCCYFAAILPLFLIKYYNGQRGPNLKYFF